MESVRSRLSSRRNNNNTGASNDTEPRRKKVGFSKRRQNNSSSSGIFSGNRSSNHSRSSYNTGSSSRRFIPRRKSNVGSSLSYLGYDDNRDVNEGNGAEGKSLISFVTSLESRLAETKVYILYQDGGREYKDMTLRDLYTYVMNAIKERPPLNLGRSISTGTNNVNQSLSTMHSNATNDMGFIDFASPAPYPRGNIQSCNKASPTPCKPTTTINTATLPPPPPLSMDVSQQLEQEQQQHMRHSSSASTFNTSNLTMDQTNTTDPSASTTSSTHADYRQSKKERKMTIVDDAELTPPPSTTQKTLTSTPPPKPTMPSDRSSSIATRTTTTTDAGGDGEKGSITAAPVTYRERLGGYLHPRDMRRLVTPFSTSNEAELIVRRHVMLLNFDPLRAIVLRDRLLVVVPDGADTILEDLEKRLRGGIVELENTIFGDGGADADADADENEEDGENEGGVVVGEVDDMDAASGAAYVAVANDNPDSPRAQNEKLTGGDNKDESGGGGGNDDVKKDDSATENDDDDDDDDSSYHDDSTATTANPVDIEHDFENEWEDIDNRNWIDMPFELQSVDAVITSVTSMLHQDVRDLTIDCHREMDIIRRQGEHAPEKLRELKDFVNALQSRVQGFIRAVNLILDDDEDMALMNLSRLITHPERFIQPVSEEIIHEESDEPELILEGHLQQALNTVNSLELLKGQIESTEQAVNMNLDGVRNKLLFINTLVSVASLCTAVASLVGSIFGMNLVNHLEDDTDAFLKVVVGTLVGMFVLFILLLLMFYQASTMKKLDVSRVYYLGSMHKKYD